MIYVLRTHIYITHIYTHHACQCTSHKQLFTLSNTLQPSIYSPHRIIYITNTDIHSPHSDIYINGSYRYTSHTYTHITNDANIHPISICIAFTHNHTRAKQNNLHSAHNIHSPHSDICNAHTYIHHIHIYTHITNVNVHPISFYIASATKHTLATQNNIHHAH